MSNVVTSGVNLCTVFSIGHKQLSIQLHIMQSIKLYTIQNFYTCVIIMYTVQYLLNMVHS